MPSAAEPRPESVDKVLLTAGALDQLDAQVADADSRRSKHAAYAESDSKRADRGSWITSPAPHTTITTTTGPTATTNIPSAPSAPDALSHNPDAVPPMTDYSVDGTVYRCPDTLGTLIEVRPCPGKGLAMFALRDLPAGTLLLSERPLVKLDDDGSRADPLDGLVNALSPALKRAYRSLHGYQEVAPPPPSRTTTITSPPRPRRNPPPRESLNRRVLYSNGFAIETTTTAVFAVASRFNHSCVPNARFHWDAAADRMDYVAAAKLLEGEEVTIDYGHRKGRLWKYYGFECACGGCTEWGSVSTSEDGSVAVQEGRLVQGGGLGRPVEAAAGGVNLDGEVVDGGRIGRESECA